MAINQSGMSEWIILGIARGLTRVRRVGGVRQGRLRGWRDREGGG